MKRPRLSLVMGGNTPTPEGGELTLPLSDTGTVHLHVHIGEGDTTTAKVAKNSVGGWTSLVFGVAVMAAFAGGYQFGHRLTPDDVSNLRPLPALAGLTPPEAAPSPMTGLPAIQRQLATPPQIIVPQRAPPQPGAAAILPTPLAPGVPAPARNAFGLEN